MKSNWKKLIPYGIIIVLLIALGVASGQAYNNKMKFREEKKLTIALNDTITRYKNKNGELVSEKRTLQTTIDNLEELNGYLTDSQKELVKRVKEVEKENSIITAALIDTRIVIDSLRDATEIMVDTSGGTIKFSDSTANIQYVFIASNVLPKFANINPKLTINKLDLPNRQFIEFHWKDNKREGYPISFSVSNSNPYFETTNIESYAIPELQKPVIKPNFWQKTWKGIKKTGPYLIGGAFGAGTMYIITR